MTGFDRPHIAIVDDNPSVLESLENLFTSVGYDVRSYASASEFLGDDVLDSIACLISDVGMPGMNGLELQDCVLKHRSNLPVILITGRHELIQADAVAANNRGIFRKPLDVLALVKAVADVLQAPP